MKLKILAKNKSVPPVESNISSLAHNGNEYFAQQLILLNDPLTGNLYCAEQSVIEVNGHLTGNVISKACTVSGRVDGNLTAVESICIKSTAKIKGAVKAPLIEIEEGAVVNGKVMITTDIYAMVTLTDKLKHNLPVDELPAKLNIASAAVAMSARTDEPAKPLEQKANVSKPAAAALPVSKPEPVMATPAIVKLKPAAAAASPASKAEQIEPVPTASKSKPAAAAAQPSQNNNTDEANGRWW